MLGFLFLYFGVTEPDKTIEHCISFECNIKVLDFYQNREIYVTGVDCYGNRVKYEISNGWFSKKDLKVGDSIIKKAGDKELRIVRNHKSQIYPLILSDTVMWNDSCCLYEDYKHGRIIKFKPKNY